MRNIGLVVRGLKVVIEIKKSFIAGFVYFNREAAMVSQVGLSQVSVQGWFL